MQKRSNLLTLLCVIYQPHKENAVYSELISKLFSLRVSEQAGSCPELQSHPQRPALAAGPAPRGTAPPLPTRVCCAPRARATQGGRRKESCGGGGVCFLTPSYFACLPQICQGAAPSPQAPDPDTEVANRDSEPIAGV